MFRRAAILGTGLLGGSVALALKEKGLVEKIVGTSRQEASLKTALDRGVIDEACGSDVNRAIQGADLVILASPVKIILENIYDISKHLRRGCIVTDVGSTKAAIVDAAEKHFPPHVLFVGSHPMAGSEKSGIGHASADLFRNTACIMTPTDKTNKVARDKIKQLWTLIGSEVRFMDPAKHDEALAYVSHLPHMVAFSLIKAIPDELLQYGSSGLRDTTRIASSSPKMWTDICLSNYRNVLKAIDESVKSLSEARKAVVARDEQALIQYFTQAKAKRETLEKKI
jgi:prephenate dehydrogenase